MTIMIASLFALLFIIVGFGLSSAAVERQAVFLNASMPNYVTAVSDAQRVNSSRKIVTVLSSINYDGSSFLSLGPLCVKSMEIALDRLRMQPNWLPNYDFRIELVNDQCSDEFAISGLMKHLSADKTASNGASRLPIYFACFCSPICQRIGNSIGRQHNILSFLTAADDNEMFYNRKRYRSAFALAESADAPFIALAEFILKMGWKKIGAISEIYNYFNGVDTLFLPVIDKRNISLVWMGKVTYQSQDAEEMSATFAEIKARGPRIIVCNINSPIIFGCWAYRFGLYGPDYVFFIQYWNYFEAETVKIPPFLSWCTRDMIREFRKSFIFFGEYSIPNLFGESVKDSTGWSSADFRSELAARVVAGETHYTWGFWPPFCYDEALFAGYLVNATETLLQSRNSTLSNWAANEANFDYSMNQNVIEEAMYSMNKVVGYKGEYQFEEKTTQNSLGYTPVTFSQPDKDGMKLVGYYKSNEPIPLIIVPNALVWNTVDHLPPKDFVRTITLLERMVHDYEAIIFTVIGIIGIALCTLFLISSFIPAMARNRIKMAIGDYIAFIGHIFLLAHLFAYMDEAFSTQAGNSAFCYSYTSLIVIGLSVSIFGTAIKLEKGRFSFPSRRRGRSIKSSQKSDKAGSNTPKPKIVVLDGDPAGTSVPGPSNVSFDEITALPKGSLNSTNLLSAEICEIDRPVSADRASAMSIVAAAIDPFEKKPTALFVPICEIVQIAVIAAWFARHPIIRQEVPLELEMLDTSTKCQRFYLNCTLDKGDSASMGLMAVMICIHFFLLLREGIVAYQLRLKTGVLAIELKRTGISIYCEILVLLAVALIVATNLSNGRFIQLTVSSGSICICAIRICFKAIGEAKPTPRSVFTAVKTSLAKKSRPSPSPAQRPPQA